MRCEILSNTLRSRTAEWSFLVLYLTTLSASAAPLYDGHGHPGGPIDPYRPEYDRAGHRQLGVHRVHVAGGNYGGGGGGGRYAEEVSVSSSYGGQKGNEYQKDSKYYYGGQYKDECSGDGLYYKDDTTFVMCSNGYPHEQPCPPGTKTSGSPSYKPGYYYGYTDLCSVNLVDYGLGPEHYAPVGYPQAGGGHRDGYGGGREGEAYGKKEVYDQKSVASGYGGGSHQTHVHKEKGYSSGPAGASFVKEAVKKDVSTYPVASPGNQYPRGNALPRPYGSDHAAARPLASASYSASSVHHQGPQARGETHISHGTYTAHSQNPSGGYGAGHAGAGGSYHGGGGPGGYPALNAYATKVGSSVHQTANGVGGATVTQQHKEVHRASGHAGGHLTDYAYPQLGGVIPAGGPYQGPQFAAAGYEKGPY